MKAMQRELPLGDAVRPSPPGNTAQRRARDRSLDQLQAARDDLIKAARAIADELVTATGEVTSPQVVDELRKRGWGAEMDAVDPRFMGPVFRRGWVRVGWLTGRTSPGSHTRPVAIWRRK